MKKFLPLMACAMLAYSASAAVDEPQIHPGMVINTISHDGSWAVSSNEIDYKFDILNLNTGEIISAGEDLQMTCGLGHYVSNNGVVVASGYNDELGYYWENGNWHLLPILDTDFAAYPNAITADGNRIAGCVSKTAMSLDETNQVMTIPVVWNRNESGTFDLYEVLDYPQIDWTGRVPQYVLIDDISADGTVCAGNIVDYSGMAIQPISFTQDAEGAWSYEALGTHLMNPEGIQLPEYPGESPEKPEPQDFMDPDEAEAYDIALNEWYDRPYPQKTDFMSEEERAAYEAAYEAYWTDWENNPYPYIDDYMTEEELAAYTEALKAYGEDKGPDYADYMTEEQVEAYEEAIVKYELDYAAWEEAFYAFDDAFWGITSDPNAVNFSMNSARISPNGAYLAMTANRKIEDPNLWMGYSEIGTPYVFDLENASHRALSSGVQDVYATMIMDDETVIGATPSGDFSRNAVIAEGGSDELVYLYDAMKVKAPSIATWMEENMLHEIEEMDYEYNEETDDYDVVFTYEDKMLAGTPFMSSDMKVMVSWTFNAWDYESGEYFYSYVLPLGDAFSGIVAVENKAKAFGAVLDINGMLTVNGDVKSVMIYDINGRMVYTTTGAQTVNTGLTRGAYIVKVIANDGKVKVSKANI